MLMLAEEMSEDEVFALMAGLAFAAVGVWHWISTLHFHPTIGPRPASRLLLAPVPALLLAVILLPVLLAWSSHDVRGDMKYVGLFFVVGGAWMTGALIIMPFLGLHLRDDAIERRNPAVAIAAAGVLAGVTLSFTGANIGEGPTIWTTIGPAFIATATLIVAWALLEMVTRLSDAIAIDRDAATAWRFAGFMAAGGLITGRAMSGDWQSLDATLIDFVQAAWPFAALVVAAGALHFVARPSPSQPSPPVMLWGVFPALLFVALAIGWVVFLGPW